MSDTHSPNPYDASFQLRERHPDFQDYFDRNDALSEKTRNDFPLVADIPYGVHSSQTIDWFPAQNARSPVFVFIHGGFWRALDKRPYHFTGRPFLEGGYAVAHVNYRLAPEATMTEIVDDVALALNSIHERAPEYNGDPTAMSICGHSAGGHLALMGLIQLTASTIPAASSIQHALCISGLFDLDPIRNSYLNEELRFDQSTVDAYSPINIQSVNTRANIVFAVGTNETEQFVVQSRDMARHMEMIGHPCQFLPLNGLNHYDIVHQLALRDSPLTRSILASSTSD